MAKKTAKEDIIDFESMYEGVDELGVRGYKLSHLEDHYMKKWDLLIRQSVWY